MMKWADGDPELHIVGFVEGVNSFSGHNLKRTRSVVAASAIRQSDFGIGLARLHAGDNGRASSGICALLTDTKVSSTPLSDRSEVPRLVSCAREGGEHDTSNHCY